MSKSSESKEKYPLDEVDDIKGVRDLIHSKIYQLLSLLFAILVISGCGKSEFCGTPSIYDENGNLVTGEIREKISKVISYLEEIYPPLTCGLDEIEVLPRDYYEELYPDNSKAVFLNGPNFLGQDICNPKIVLKEESAELIDVIVPTQQALLHEIMHLHQADCSVDDLGYDDFIERFGDDPDYGASDQDRTKYVSDTAGLGVDEDHAETISYWVYFPINLELASNPDLQAKANFAEEILDSSIDIDADTTIITEIPDPLLDAHGRILTALGEYHDDLTGVEIIGYMDGTSSLMIYQYTGSNWNLAFEIPSMQADWGDVVFNGDEIISINKIAGEFSNTILYFLNLPTQQLTSLELDLPDNNVSTYSLAAYDDKIFLLPTHGAVENEEENYLTIPIYEKNSGLLRFLYLEDLPLDDRMSEKGGVELYYSNRASGESQLGIYSNNCEQIFILDLDKEELEENTIRYPFTGDPESSLGFTVTQDGIIYALDFYSNSNNQGFMLIGEKEQALNFVSTKTDFQGLINPEGVVWSSVSIGNVSYFYILCDGDVKNLLEVKNGDDEDIF